MNRRWWYSGLLLALSLGSAHAQDWQVGGSLTFAAERYSVSGDEAQSPYIALGTHRYVEGDLYFSRRISEYEWFDGEFAALLNDSAYRSEFRHGVLERGRLRWEKGDVTVPFEVQLGDIFAYQSLRTVQRGLKGLLLELQPQLGWGAEHSLEVFSGVSAATYEHLDGRRDRFSGLSWLSDWDGRRAVAFNVARYQPGEGFFYTPQAHDVASLAFEQALRAGSQDLTAELELAWYRDESQSDDGQYFKLEGRDRHRPLDYRLVLEDYGEHYRPAGAAISPDQRALELRAGWRFDNALRLRGRYEHYRERPRSDNPDDTRVLGFDLAGPVLPGIAPRIQGVLEAFVEKREDREGFHDNRTESYSGELSSPVGATRWSVNGGLRYIRDEDRVYDEVARTREAWLAADWDFGIGSANGTFSPGLQVRENRGSSDQLEVGPSLSLALYSGRHNLRASWKALDQRPDLWADQQVRNLALEYSYRGEWHELRIEADQYSRREDLPDAEDTDAYRVGIFWTLYFEKQGSAGKGLAAFGREPGAEPHRAVSLPVFAAMPEPGRLPPGADIHAVLERLRAVSAPAPLRRAGLLVYETDILPSLSNRQRLALEHEGGALRQATLIVDIEERGGPEQALHTYEQVREWLLRRYGRPDRRVEAGQFDAHLPMALAVGDFERTLQWHTGSGLLSLTIPRRTDGRIRLEISHADSGSGPRVGQRVAALR
ncbi:hypothetical protein [Alkalilimnicola sp. S0819]|uniref:hypothetical protein n=1 Tax=Alkalilimnicola sp. S0819 TaxID=2613922 RepID=UPI0012624A31|nr:hypothetical protein [Alkalilimnicola sp. S0819]KAB7627796.1 hypothetical protein F3N43_02130 [Alkalilimnicola sp. S0819]MPQ15426.1 hypothetical protein [Alkalilimnicola sp. S0819]